MENESKYIECVHCEHFFECKAKVGKADKCVNFKERKDG